LPTNEKRVTLSNLILQGDEVGAVLGRDGGLILPAVDDDFAGNHSPAVGELLLHFVYLPGILLRQRNEVERRRTAPLEDLANYFILHGVITPVLCQNLAVNKGIDRFLNKHGQLAQIPVKEDRRLEILEHLAKDFEPEAKLSEAEVNTKVMAWHGDYVMLRRMLVDYKFLSRSIDGRTYWRSKLAE
jgi:hypothetical protein